MKLISNKLKKKKKFSTAVFLFDERIKKYHITYKAILNQKNIACVD